MLSYPQLIEALRQAFQENYTVPKRHHHNYKNPQAETDSTLLLMPAWQVGKYLGVKLVTISPKNGTFNWYYAGHYRRHRKSLLS